MAYQDPWSWADEHTRVQPVPQLNNTLQVPTANAQQPQITQGPPGIGEMAQNILVARGVNKGIDAGINAMTPAQGPLAPVVDAGGAVEVLPGAATGAEVAGTAAAATEGAAVASAGTTAATAGAGAAEAGTLAAMGPVGWGVGALLLAKQMKWI